MNYVRVALMGCLSLWLGAGSASHAAENGRKIMVKYDETYRESYSAFYNKMELATCSYVVKKGSMHCAEKPRVIVVEGVRKFYGKDFKSVAVVLEPASEKGIGLLYYEYYDSTKDNDNWMYLPAFGKVKRIIADSDGSGSFLGTENTNEDMQAYKVENYTYKVLGEEMYDDRPVWILELTPTAVKAKKSAYSKTILRIDRERHIRLRADLYNHHGKLCKIYSFKNIARIDNVWIPGIQIMNNLLDRRVTVNTIDLKTVSFHLEIPDEFFTHRVLSDFVFREQNMTKLRNK